MARVAPLAITISAGDSRPIARQIIDAIRMAITTGELSVDDKLPSVRGLAQQLSVNPNTIVKAYAQLTSEGWLTARPGLGLFVAARRERYNAEERERRIDEAAERFVDEVVAVRYDPDAAAQKVADLLATLTLRQSA